MLVLAAPPRQATAAPVASTSAQPYSPPRSPRSPRSVPQSQPILINGTLTLTASPATSGNRVKKFACTHPGCPKAFTRPVRLQEHQRTHTGERPFQCPSCPATFARDSHLKAHLRTHASEEEKPLSCHQCDKRFWTNQHLKKHVELIHQGKTYDCTSCSATFRKHHLLRTHIAEVHSTPGTNPFICEHPGCDKSFKQNVHLKAHVKTHDPSRYLCLHPTCLLLPLVQRQYPTWSSLQKHTKISHPPTCPYPECQGKVFASNRGLKGHLALHEESGGKIGGRKRRRGKGKGKGKGKKSSDEEETAEETGQEETSDVQVDRGVVTTARTGGGNDDYSSAEEEDDEQWQLRQEEERDSRMSYDFARGGKKKRRIQKQRDLEQEEEEEEEEAEFGTKSPWVCEIGLSRGGKKCGRRFKDADALESHQSTSHPSLPMVSPSFNLPPLPTLPSTFNATKKSDATYQINSHAEPPLAPPGVSLLDLITGANYAPPSTSPDSGDKSKRRFPCPFPSILDIAFPLPSSPSTAPFVDVNREGEKGTHTPCAYWFSRIYDVQRHLRSRHKVEVERRELGEWFEEGESESESEGSGEDSGEK